MHHHHHPHMIDQEDRSRSKMTKSAAVNVTKLRGAFKKISNLGHMLNHHRSKPTTPESSTATTPSSRTPVEPAPVDEGATTAGAGPVAGADDRLLTVYVGKSRRAYRVESELLDHPIMQDLVQRSDGSGEILVACEVVMFDHFRWMIQNSDPQHEHLDDLKEYYAY